MKFSIITCTHNSEEFLLNNIHSIENQTYKDFEHVFIDGYSKDNTLKIINEYKNKYPERVRIIQTPPRGIADAMNQGIRISKGEYVMHLHSDDQLFDSEVLMDTDKFMRINNNPDLLYGKANFINIARKRNRIIPHRLIYHKMNFYLLLMTNYIPHQAVFIKKNIFNKFGFFDENLKQSMDYDLWLRLSSSNIKATFFDRLICKFLVHEASKSYKNKKDEHREVLKKHLKSEMLVTLFDYIHKINKLRM